MTQTGTLLTMKPGMLQPGFMRPVCAKPLQIQAKIKISGELVPSGALAAGVLH
jgi:hypothetical protein